MDIKIHSNRQKRWSSYVYILYLNLYLSLWTAKCGAVLVKPSAIILFHFIQ